jgi:hypothetical protein
MDLNILKWNLFQNSAMKQAKYLVSQPNKAQPCIYISEAGTVSLEVLPMNTGFVQASNDVKKAWVVVHPLKRQILKNGQPWRDDSVLSVCDRDYYPLDPHNVLDPKVRKNMNSLQKLAKMNHAKYRHDIGKAIDPNARITEAIVTWSFIMLALIGIGALIIN